MLTLVNPLDLRFQLVQENVIKLFSKKNFSFNPSCYISNCLMILKFLTQKNFNQRQKKILGHEKSMRCCYLSSTGCQHHLMQSSFYLRAYSYRWYQFLQQSWNSGWERPLVVFFSSISLSSNQCFKQHSQSWEHPKATVGYAGTILGLEKLYHIMFC